MSFANHILPLTLATAARAIGRGELVVFPTETYFALGGDGTRSDVVDRVFVAKRRAHDNPLPLILPRTDWAGMVAEGLSPLAQRLARDYWPGPLSILLPAKPSLPQNLTGGSGLVAVRVSPHPVARALCEACGVPIIASSANISGFPPVAYVDGLDPALVSQAAGVIMDGPDPAGGMPSTIVRPVSQAGGEALEIVRPGVVSPADFAKKGYVLL